MKVGKLPEGQLGLWTPAPYVRDSSTSLAAAVAIEPVRNNYREKVYDAIAARRGTGARGLIDEEGYESLGMSPSTYRPRRVELVASGRVRDSGVERRTKSRKRAVVWEAV